MVEMWIAADLALGQPMVVRHFSFNGSDRSVPFGRRFAGRVSCGYVGPLGLWVVRCRQPGVAFARLAATSLHPGLV